MFTTYIVLDGVKAMTEPFKATYTSSIDIDPSI